MPLDLRIGLGQPGVQVFGVPSRLGSLEGPQVFLRHRLLPQPDGFEGFLVIPEELLQDDLALSERQDLAELQVPPESRLFAGVALSDPQDHGVTGVDQILDHRLAAHRFRDSLVEGAYGVPPILDALRPTLGGAEHLVLVTEVNRRVEITPVPVLKGLPRKLHVLLRHRTTQYLAGVSRFPCKAAVRLDKKLRLIEIAWGTTGGRTRPGAGRRPSSRAPRRRGETPRGRTR